MSGEVEEDEERRRQRKLEEALEVKSLRRIISAYLNYPEAAEEDVRRYERSYTRLPPAHKALLSHYPLKFQKLRRCISVNSYFIFTMLQVFEPPLDMSQDVDNCEDPHLDNSQHEHCHSEGRNALSCQSASTSGRTCSWNHSQACSPERSSTINNQMEEVQEVGSEHQHEPVSISCSREGGNDKETAECCGDNVTDSDGNVIRFDSFHGGYLLSFTKKNEISDVDRMKFNVGFSSPRDWLDSSLQSNVPLVDVDKVRCIIRNIVRDWAAEGVKERQQCYKPILEELDGLFPNRSKESPPACLVPGAGLGRLALEISCLGFISQGNEFSYYMMICSSFILNHTERTGQWTIYPWIHSNCNSLSENDQLRPVSIPDIHPAGAGITEGFSMCGGDFVEVYNDSSQIGIWDAVVTCFFIDTAHNIIEYVEIISKVLKEGGVWINFGPLLYHFADMYGQEDDMSIELSLEDVKKVAFHYGFQLEKEQMIETTYTTNPRSMMQNHYHAAFWTMRKKRTTSTT